MTRAQRSVDAAVRGLSVESRGRARDPFPFARTRIISDRVTMSVLSSTSLRHARTAFAIRNACPRLTYPHPSQRT